jgi:predicted ATPase
VTGANGSGKSNLYRALRLIRHVVDGRLAEALAAEGGMPSIQWAGPSDVRAQTQRGLRVQGTASKGPTRVCFGFATETLAYEIRLGLPTPTSSLFALDPEVKEEFVWHWPKRRPANTFLHRDGPLVTVAERDGSKARLGFTVPPYRSVLPELGEPHRFPEVFALRESVRRWRFYDGFRVDAESPIRQPRTAVRTEVLADDGRDLPAALQTILEIGDGAALHEAVSDAFPGSRVEIDGDGQARLSLSLATEGLLRPLAASELSDGTLRYLCLLAALSSPRPPELLVLNEPEASLHPDLMRPLARLIAGAARVSQVWVITHSNALVEHLERAAQVDAIELQRAYGETRIAGQGVLDEPVWP